MANRANAAVIRMARKTTPERDGDILGGGVVPSGVGLLGGVLVGVAVIVTVGVAVGAAVGIGIGVIVGVGVGVGTMVAKP